MYDTARSRLFKLAESRWNEARANDAPWLLNYYARHSMGSIHTPAPSPWFTMNDDDKAAWLLSFDEDDVMMRVLNEYLLVAFGTRKQLLRIMKTQDGPEQLAATKLLQAIVDVDIEADFMINEDSTDAAPAA